MFFWGFLIGTILSVTCLVSNASTPAVVDSDSFHDFVTTEKILKDSEVGGIQCGWHLKCGHSRRPLKHYFLFFFFWAKPPCPFSGTIPHSVSASAIFRLRRCDLRLGLAASSRRRHLSIIGRLLWTWLCGGVLQLTDKTCKPTFFFLPVRVRRWWLWV